MSETRVELPTKEQFLEHLGTKFKATLEDGQVFEIEFLRLDEKISTKIQEGYSLIFKAPLETPPFQGMFHLEHETLEPLDLFLVPINQKEDGLIFEAVFNLLKI